MEQRSHARLKACSGDTLRLKEELDFCKDQNAKLSQRVQETQQLMQQEQEVIEERLEGLRREKESVEEEN